MKKTLIIISIICSLLAVALSSCKNEPPAKPALSAQEIDLSDYSSFFMLADNYESRSSLWGFNEKSKVIEEVKIQSSTFGLFHLSSCEKVGSETIIIYSFADSDHDARQKFVYNIRLRKAVEFNSKWQESISQARNGFYYCIGTECFYYDMETDVSEIVFDGKIKETSLPYYQFYSTNYGNLLIKSGDLLYCKPLDKDPVVINNANFKPFEQYSSGPWTYNGYLLTSPTVDYFIDLKEKKKYSITSTGLEVSSIDIAPVGEGRHIVSFIEPRGFNYLYDCFTYPQCITYFNNANTIRIDRIVDGELETISYSLPPEMAAKDRDQMTFNDNKVFLYQSEEDEETTSLKCTLKYYDCITDEVFDIYEGTVLRWNHCGAGIVYVKYKNAVSYETIYYDCISHTSTKILDKASIIRGTVWFYP